MELIGRLVGEERALALRLAHPARPRARSPPGSSSRQRRIFAAGRRDVGVVLVEPEPELRVVERRIEGERLIERLLDPFAVARRGDVLSAQHAQLDARAVGAADVEPRFGALRLARGPGLGGGDRARRRRR